MSAGSLPRSGDLARLTYDAHFRELVHMVAALSAKLLQHRAEALHVSTDTGRVWDRCSDLYRVHKGLSETMGTFTVNAEIVRELKRCVP